MRYELLATAIPAMSFAAGAAEIPVNENTKHIFNLNLEKEGRSAGPPKGTLQRIRQGAGCTATSRTSPFLSSIRSSPR
jgi:hypothetical protein